MTAALRGMRALWGRQLVWPLLVPPLYALAMAALGRTRPEHWLLLGVCWFFAFGGRKLKQFFLEILPYLLFLYGYDLVRLGRDLFLSERRVLGCEMRALELKLFGFGTGRTPGEWLSSLHQPTLDLLFAAPYFVFAYLVFIYAAFLYFVDRPRMRLYLWSFAVANFAAFVIWLALPVAPPWYVHQHGCIIDIAAAPSPAGLLRVDARLGFSYFNSLYSKSAYVFGAMPSMHCAFPMLGLLTAWPSITWKTKPLHIAYVVLMFVASAYLDHHYLLDGLVGFALSIIVVVTVRRVLRHVAPGTHDVSRTAPLGSS